MTDMKRTYLEDDGTRGLRRVLAAVVPCCAFAAGVFCGRGDWGDTGGLMLAAAFGAYAVFR